MGTPGSDAYGITCTVAAELCACCATATSTSARERRSPHPPAPVRLRPTQGVRLTFLDMTPPLVRRPILTRSVVNEIASLTLMAQRRGDVATTRAPFEMACAAHRSASPNRSRSTSVRMASPDKKTISATAPANAMALPALVLVPPPLADDQRVFHLLRKQWQWSFTSRLTNVCSARCR